jgi:hypothetical protein
METAVVAALAGLFGIVIGRVWDLRLKAVRWRRDQRIRVYEDLATNYYAAREPLLVLAMAEPGTPEADAAAIRVLEIAAEWNRRYSRNLTSWVIARNGYPPAFRPSAVPLVR